MLIQAEANGETLSLLVNDIKALASQLNHLIVKARQKGLKVDLTIESLWKTDETFMRDRVSVKVWQELN